MRIAAMAAIVAVAMACSSRPSPTLAAEEVPAQDTENEQEALDVLGRRFVRALKNENLVAYSQCWLPAGMMPVMLDQAPPDAPRPTPEQLESFFTNTLQRDREIAESFPRVIERLKEISADLSGMELVSISAQVREQQGFKTTSRFELTVRIDDETTVKLDLDDGRLFNGVWYVTDTSVGVVRE